MHSLSPMPGEHVGRATGRGAIDKRSIVVCVAFSTWVTQTHPLHGRIPPNRYTHAGTELSFSSYKPVPLPQPHCCRALTEGMTKNNDISTSHQSCPTEPDCRGRNSTQQRFCLHCCTSRQVGLCRRVDEEAGRRELLSVRKWKVVVDLFSIWVGQWFPEVVYVLTRLMELKYKGEEISKNAKQITMTLTESELLGGLQKVEEGRRVEMPIVVPPLPQTITAVQEVISSGALCGCAIAALRGAVQVYSSPAPQHANCRAQSLRHGVNELTHQPTQTSGYDQPGVDWPGLGGRKSHQDPQTEAPHTCIKKEIRLTRPLWRPTLILLYSRDFFDDHIYCLFPFLTYFGGIKTHPSQAVSVQFQTFSSVSDLAGGDVIMRARISNICIQLTGMSKASVQWCYCCSGSLVGLDQKRKSLDLATKLKIIEECENTAKSFDYLVLQKCAQGIPVEGPMLKAKAAQLLLSESIHNDVVSSWQPILASILNKLEHFKIFNADELGMFYNLLSEMTLAMRNYPCKGGKRSKEIFTLLLCANMDGDDKRKPFVIGKSIPTLSKLFKQWLHSFDVKTGVKNHKVLFELQPLDQGVFNLLKRELHTMLVNAVMKKLAAGKTICKWNVIEAIKAIAKIVFEMIAACFRHAGYKKNLAKIELP
ncbi:hypothetical protein PR048_015584 [Dryococelus australis]|uniref:Uncharacterized protein n=1 Tax=Dryococelus australis TaxID=614101 RepID=A0ABQ9HHI4_9NEOP|nr:hypothetical protein PR048_015584 [Dryococelus australis]